MNLFERSWAHAWADLGLQPPADVWSALLAAYDEPQRHYHSQQHLGECLAHFDAVRPLAQHPGEVEIALWFHDAVYDVRGTSNERQSADWARRVLGASGADEATQQRVDALIMATRHDAAPGPGDEQLLVDIDLSILGAAPERFAEYDRQVLTEYRWVPGFVYKMKRRAVLSAFLARPRIYGTGHFSARCEAQARANLAWAIDGRAGSQPPPAVTAGPPPLR